MSTGFRYSTSHGTAVISDDFLEILADHRQFASDAKSKSRQGLLNFSLWGHFCKLKKWIFLEMLSSLLHCTDIDEYKKCRWFGLFSVCRRSVLSL